MEKKLLSIVGPNRHGKIKQPSTEFPTHFSQNIEYWIHLFFHFCSHFIGFSFHTQWISSGLYTLNRRLHSTQTTITKYDKIHTYLENSKFNHLFCLEMNKAQITIKITQSKNNNLWNEGTSEETQSQRNIWPESNCKWASTTRGQWSEP
jgi:hypothetical protein